MPKIYILTNKALFFDQIDQKWLKIYHLGLFIQNDPHFLQTNILASDLYFQKSFLVLDMPIQQDIFFYIPDAKNSTVGIK